MTLECVLAEGAIAVNLWLVLASGAVELVVELAQEVHQPLWRPREAVDLQLIVDSLDPGPGRLPLPNLGAAHLEQDLIGLDLEEVVAQALHYLVELDLVLAAKDLEELRIGVDDLPHTL